MVLPDNIEDLIYRIKAGEATPDECEELQRLMEQGRIPEKEYREILRAWYYVRYTCRWKQVDVQKAWHRMARHTVGARRRRRVRMLVAASLALLVGIGGMWWYGNGRQQPAVTVAGGVKPGHAGAELILASGEKVDLSSVLPAELREGDAVIAGDTAVLVYRHSASAGDTSTKSCHNELLVPKGGEYRLVLSDGTTVYVNSDSRLKYPVTFSGQTREVELEGEAYFEVAAAAGKPFIVHATGVEVNVLGTGFNVMAYGNEQLTEVTLVHGKVNVVAGRQSEILTPDRQLVYNRATGEAAVRRVDTRFYVSWKDGILNFDAMPLELLARKLARWFDVDFSFADDALKQLKFSGAFKKYNDIEYILSLIEVTTDVRFSLQGRVVTVSKK